MLKLLCILNPAILGLKFQDRISMNNLLNFNNLCFLVLVTFLYAGSCLAEETNEFPVHINSDKLEYNSEEKVLYLKGNVGVRHPEGILVADNATVYQDTDEKEGKDAKSRMGNVKRIVAVGNVRMSSKGAITISDKAVWDGVNNTITLSGGPPIAKQDAVHTQADRIIYDIETGKASFYPNPKIIIGLSKKDKARFLE